MKKFDIELSEKYGFLQPCKLQCFLHEKGTRASMLIFPGGGYYTVCGDREGEPIASRFYRNGFNAFILTYSTADRAPGVKYPMQLLQATAAIIYIRENAKAWNCTDDVITCGFSAGAHLAGMAAVYYGRKCVLDAFGVNSKLARPSAAVLSYPVVSGITTPHLGSFENLTQKGADLKDYSLELSVDKNTPPVFIWHTANDACVNVMNSIVFGKSLSENNIPFEMHIFENGHHGLALCDRTTWDNNPGLINPEAAVWFKLCVIWLKKRFKNAAVYGT